MRVLTINELMRLTRKELCDLAARITAALPHYAGRIGGTRQRADQSAQHPLGAGPARACAGIGLAACSTRCTDGTVAPYE